MDENKLEQVGENMQEFFSNIEAIKGNSYAKLLASLLSFAQMARVMDAPTRIIFQCLDAITDLGVKHSVKEILEDLSTAMKIADQSLKGLNDEPT